MKLKHLQLNKLIQSGLYLGDPINTLNPSINKQNIFGIRKNNYVINLNHTLKMINKLIQIILYMKKNNGNILFIGSKNDVYNIIEQTAIRLNQFYANLNWIGGFLTNKDQINKAFKVKFDLIIIFDINQSTFPINEAIKLNLPIIGIGNTSNNITKITYPILTNEKSTESINFYCKLIENIMKDNNKNINQFNLLNNLIENYKKYIDPSIKYKKHMIHLKKYKSFIFIKKKYTY